MKFQQHLLAILIAAWMIPTQAAIVPNAGQLLQQEQQGKLPQLQQGVSIEQQELTPKPIDSELQVLVKRIDIAGNQRFSTDKLHALVVDAEEQMMSLSQLQDYVERITDYYHNAGYLYSRAYLPQQTLSQGIVQIQVLEAYYDQPEVNNNSRTQDWLIQKTLAPLQIGQQIGQTQLENQLKLLNRLEGVETKNTLRPGRTSGSSQLLVDVYDTDMLNGYVGVDNFGNEFTNEVRTTAGLRLNNLAGLGDSLSLDAMTGGVRLNYGKLGYALTVNGYGTRIGAAYSYLNYKLGKEMERLDAKGNAEQTSVFIVQPALLTNTSEVLLSLQYDHKHLEDDVVLNKFYKNRDVDLVTARLDGSHYDQWAGGGLTQYGASSSFGHVKYKNEVAKILDNQTAKTSGDYYSVSLNLSRLQNLGEHGTQGYLAVYGQYSPYNLDISEQYFAGGPFSVRGYDINQLSGSSGYLSTAELRQRLFSNNKQQIAAKLFVDHAGITLNAKPWFAQDDGNHIHISSTGLGLNWQSVWDLQANAEVGFPIGSTPKSLKNRDDEQFWLSVRYGF
jgi:hemolysin activation/secretion protein